jgi:hypothetical protein
MGPVRLPSKDQLQRFDELWQTLVDDTVPLRVLSFEYALRFLEGEVSLQRLRNERLRKVLANLIHSKGRWVLNQPPALYANRTLLAPEVQQGYSRRIDSLVAEARDIFARGDHVRALIAFIEARTCSSDPLDSDFRNAVRELAIAFILRGVDVSRLKTLLSEVFFERTTVHEGLLHTTYPEDTIEPPLPELDLENPESIVSYNKALQAAIDSLTVSSRFEALWKSYQRQPQALTYIFPINGIKGRQSLNIGRVELYPPFLSPKADKAGETIGRERPDSLNAAITLSSLNSEEDRSNAARQVQAHLDVLAFFVESRLPIEVDANKCVILREDGALYGEAMRSPRLPSSLEHKYYARNVDDLVQNLASLKSVLDTASRVGSLGAESEVRLQEALRAILKSNQTEVLEDRLVNAWIAIEALMGRAGDKEAIAAEIVPALIVNDARWGMGWQLLGFLRNVASKRKSRVFVDVFVGVTEDLLQRSFIILTDAWATLELDVFIATLDEWLTVLPRDSECFRRVIEVKEFYSKPSAAEKELKRRHDMAAEDVVFIYQVRNRIVHHAFLGSPGMNYLVDRAETFARLFMLAALRNPELPPDRLIADEIVRARQLIRRIECDPSFDLMSED